MSSPCRRGSSLTQRAYGVAGKAITRTTYTQILDGRAVPASQVQPGDLLFSRGSAFVPEYVSMAIGYGYVVHAPKPGRVVEVTKQSNMGEILVARRIARWNACRCAARSGSGQHFNPLPRYRQAGDATALSFRGDEDHERCETALQRRQPAGDWADDAVQRQPEIDGDAHRELR